MRPRRFYQHSSEGQGPPLVAVDLVVFTLDQKTLQALLVQVKEGPFAGMWAFPGGLVNRGESLDDAAKRELRERTGLKNAYLEQLYTFGRPERDPALRVVSVSYLALVPDRKIKVLRADKYAGIRWCPIAGLRSLAYDHNQVARLALQRLHAKLQYTNVAFSLLPLEFTLGELQEVYETILQHTLDRRNFRKKILALGLLTPLKKVRRGAHRPASLYAFKTRQPMVVEMV
jgi:8-oxo-dGTP diphosphatase